MAQSAVKVTAPQLITLPLRRFTYRPPSPTMVKIPRIESPNRSGENPAKSPG
jgi:hypothetical protein